VNERQLIWTAKENLWQGPLRVERAGAWYPVMNRWNRRQTVIEHDKDRMFFWINLVIFQQSLLFR